MIDKSQFKSKKELFKYLVDNKDEILDVKKGAIKHTDSVDFGTIDENIVKALQTNHKDDLENGVIKRTIIGNTYNWLDSHGDVHVKNTFAKSIKERGDRVKHFHDHEQKISAKLGEIEKVYEKEVKWSDLGVNKKGTTIALMADSNIEKDYNKGVFNQYLKGKIDQHSVGMYYVKIDLAINDDGYPQEKEIFDTYINDIGNSDVAKEQGYFFAVSEAKLVEISAVTEGSNSLTPTIENNVNPSKDNLNKENDPSKDSHKLSNNNKYKKLC
jgi:hypothetical protein